MKKPFAKLLLSFVITCSAMIPGLSSAAVTDSDAPIAAVTAAAMATPAASPTAKPTASPTAKPTATPTAKPTATPTAKPTATPTVKPAATPSAAPSAVPTATPKTSGTAAPAATSTPGTSAKNPFTGSTYTHAAMHNGKNIFLGIDVSYHQGTIDWKKVKAAGVQFAFLRLGYRGYSSGTIVLDKQFRDYAQGASAAGIPIGVYFYTEAISTTEATEEAKYCIEQLKDFTITLPVVYDFEPDTNKNGRLSNAKLSKSKATNLCKAFCSTIQEAGYQPMIYSNKSDLTNTIDGASLGKSYKIWLANYTTKTTYTGNYDFWQYSSSGKVNGITGEVDCNFWYTTNASPEDEGKINISNAAISTIANKVYSGKEKKPAVTLTYGGKILKKDVDYTVSYSNNINIGKATVTIKGINDYKGSRTTSFVIKPTPLQMIERVSTTAKKTIQLKWEKQTQASGYMVYRKGTQNGSYKKIATITSPKTTTYTDSGRGANRIYFYSVRPYIKVDSKNYPGAHSYITAATNPTLASQKLKKATKLYKEPEVEKAENELLASMKKGEAVKHLGRLYLTSKQLVYYVEYEKNGTAQAGYIPGNTEWIS